MREFTVTAKEYIVISTYLLTGHAIQAEFDSIKDVVEHKNDCNRKANMHHAVYKFIKENSE